MKYRHSMGLWSLVATGVGSIMGSGWLFVTFYAAKYSGAGAYLTWILGAVLVLCLALMLSEVITLHPKRGLFGRLLTLSHDHDTGYIVALANWLAMVAVTAAESQATVQYLAAIKQSWQPYLFTAAGDLTTVGLGFCIILLFAYGLLNFWGIKLFSKSNNIITLVKICIPVLVSVAIIVEAFHPHNFTAYHHQVLPYGISSVFAAIMTSGIVYAFNGFQTIASFCAEAKHPARNVPRAMIIAILLSLGIYLLLQTAFIAALPPNMLKQGWMALNFNSPLVDLTMLLGLNVISVIIYAGATIGPSGAALVFVGSTARMLTAMSQEQQAPSFFNVLHPKYHFSRRSLIFNTLLAIILLLFARSWHDLAILVSMFHIISYMACPLALMRLRITEPHRSRSAYRMPLAKLLCPVFFVLATLLFSLTFERLLVITAIVTSLFYLLYIVIHNNWQPLKVWHSFQRSFMMPAYFVWLMILGLLGNPKGGGFHLISPPIFYGIAIVSSLYLYYWMVYRYRPSPYFRH